jgi:hypothetical protein
LINGTSRQTASPFGSVKYMSQQAPVGELVEDDGFQLGAQFQRRQRIV